MNERYLLPEMAQVLSDETRFRTMTQIEVAVVEQWHVAGVVSSEDLDAVRQGRPPEPPRVRALEAECGHETVAFLRAFVETIEGDAGRFVHHGLTSSDVTDTATAVVLRDGLQLIEQELGALLTSLRGRTLEFWETPCIGRTHGMHAEVTTFGLKLGGHLFSIHRAAQGVRQARQGISVGTLSGPVGTYPAVNPAMEVAVLTSLGLGVEPIPTQVVARDRHARVLVSLAELGAVLERFAIEIRLLQRDEVGEAAEPFGADQVGSSSMPHKRNPMLSERVTGLSRVLRANAQVGLENVSLWHERDLTHSSAERLALPSSLGLAHYAVRVTRRVIDGLEVDTERMATNLAAAAAATGTARQLTALVEAGYRRDDARAELAQVSRPAEGGDADAGGVSQSVLASLRDRVERLEVG